MPTSCAPPPVVPGGALDEDVAAPYRKSGTGLEFSSSDCISAVSSSDSDGGSSFVDVRRSDALPPPVAAAAAAAAAVAATAAAAAASAAKAMGGAESSSIPSALLEAARKGGPAGLFAQFSGQGVDYLDELRAAYAASPAARPLVDAAAAALKVESALALAMDGGAKLLRYGLDVATWVTQLGADLATTATTATTAMAGGGGGGGGSGSSGLPPLSYLRSAPISYPLIALTQLANYVAALGAARCGQGEMGALLRGAAGHSQGVAAAVTVAWAEDDEALLGKSVLMVRYLFWHGFRMQQVFGEALPVEEVQSGTVFFLPPPSPSTRPSFAFVFSFRPA